MVKRLLAAFAVALLALVLAPAGAAHAAPVRTGDPGFITCDWPNIAWQTQASWGRAKLCVPDAYVVRAQVDDTLTDGYCVHIEFWTPAAQAWGYVPGAESCGPVTTVFYTVRVAHYSELRLVRGDETPPNGIGVNYFTLWHD